jgi:hypothetical protein
MSQHEVHREVAEYGAKREHADIEQAFTVAEIAKKWHFSEDKVRRIFNQEDGVLRFGHETLRVGKKYRRRYYVIRVPLSVFRRVEDRLRKRAGTMT